MFLVIYNIGLVLITLTALGVFACFFHACYQDLKETPPNKMFKKAAWYMATFALGFVLIFTGQHFLQDTAYTQNLHRAWAGFEGKTYLGAADNMGIEEIIEHFEIKDAGGN